MQLYYSDISSVIFLFTAMLEICGLCNRLITDKEERKRDNEPAAEQESLGLSEIIGTV